MDKLIRLIDWFIPNASRLERAELNLARNFVFTHLFGPLLSQSISVFLYVTDPAPGFACWTVIACTWLFWALPFVLKASRNLQMTAILSVELLSFTALFGAFHYGGVSSPFLPWLIISLLLAFFYLSDRPRLVIGMYALNIGAFLAAYLVFDFAQIVPLAQLASVGWISIMSATIYMSWMAIYYANIVTMRSDVERATERHREAAIRLRETKALADAANARKSLFLSKMSHELRTPLNAVIGYSEMLLETCEDDEETQADLVRINAAGKHLLSLVAEVLDLSRIESNTVEIKVETFHLGTFAREIASTTDGLVKARGNEFVLECPLDVGIVRTDQTKLRQIAINLISNAAKFTTNGKVTLALRRDRKGAGDWVEIEVSDTGLGMSTEEMKKLFKDFSQANDTTAERFGGTGLGLSISQRFCALMGGAISVKSLPGRGSSFTARVLADLASAEAEKPSLALAA